MNRLNFFLILILMGLALPNLMAQPTLKDAFAGKFYIGTALNAAQIKERDVTGCQIIKSNFNAIVAENCMKSEEIQPHEGKFNFALSDQLIEFGEKQGMWITGHVLIWHSQAPKWFFIDSRGKDVSREVLIERMKTHIYTLVGRYKGKIKGWDVVNEAIEDDGSYRQSKFYQIIGEDYIRLAFQFAREADPDAELYYNDYSMANPGRRSGVVKVVKQLQAQGVKVDGIGMQCHIGLDYPELGEFEKSVEAFAALGAKVMITEMDITVLPMPDLNVGADVSAKYKYQAELNPYAKALPDSVDKALQQRYYDFFMLFLKHQDKISRVTMWGLTDGQSWKNNWPVMGRTDYPLLYNRNYQPKPVVARIIEAAMKK